MYNRILDKIESLVQATIQTNLVNVTWIERGCMCTRTYWRNASIWQRNRGKVLEMLRIFTWVVIIWVYGKGKSHRVVHLDHSLWTCYMLHVTAQQKIDRLPSLPRTAPAPHWWAHSWAAAPATFWRACWTSLSGVLAQRLHGGRTVLGFLEAASPLCTDGSLSNLG